MTISLFGKTTLSVLTAVGLYNAVKVSYMTWTGHSPCPNVLMLPVCYIVSFGYALMFTFTLTNQVIDKYPQPFFIGWGIVFIVACLGAVTELIAGNTCPRSSLTIPLCYISFVLCLVIFYLYHRTYNMIKASKT